MLSKSRITLAAALAAAALGLSPSLALATPADSMDRRGEHAAALSDSPGVDLRTEAAVEPFAAPVVVEVEDPVSTGFDWVAAVIGLAGGVAIAVLAGVGVGVGRRRRHAQPRAV